MLRLLRHYYYFVPAQLSKAKGIGKIFFSNYS